MQLHHINIKAPAELLQREKQFFCEILALREGPRPNFSRPGYWLYDGDDPIVHLSESDADCAGEQPGYFDHVAFQSSGLARFVQHLDAAGIDYRQGFVDACDMTQVFIESPTGTGIEVNFVGESL